MIEEAKANRAQELVVKAYNINKGCNVEIAKKSPVLSGYGEFVAEINENLKTMSLPIAIKTAIRTCIRRNILLSFFESNGSEVENMLFTEWNLKDALEVAREEARETALEGEEGGGFHIYKYTKNVICYYFLNYYV